MPRRLEFALALLIMLTAAFLRLHRLADLPPGWRDDEVVETAVHAQLVLDGSFPLYFPQAEGHEPLYHYLSAGIIALGGRSLFTVRLLSVYLGLLSVAALYRFARRFFGPPTALLAAAALAVSFWSLMYSRFKLRHISEVGLMLLTFYFFLPHGPADDLNKRGKEKWRGVLAGVCLALGLYTYFAARVVPVILIGFVIYLALFQRPILRAHWHGWALTFLVAGALTAPLAWAIVTTPGTETRLGIVGRPLQDLLRGDPRHSLRNTAETLGMLAFTGDPEHLYNIPRRPVFEWVGAALFGLGLLISAWRWRQPRYAFLLIWLLGGLAPAFVSLPSASLGHTIAAQPVIYLFPAIALTTLFHYGDTKPDGTKNLRIGLMALGAVGFLGLTAWRDVRDYFLVWPILPEVRYLYRADLHEAAKALRADQPELGLVALASRNLHQADVTAFLLDTEGLTSHSEPRLFNPERAWLFPNQDATVILRESANSGEPFGQPPLNSAFAIRPTRLGHGYPLEHALDVSFANGWTCRGYTLVRDPDSLIVHLTVDWQIGAGYKPPPQRPIATLSGTPIPLRLFSHILNPDGSLITGDDRLDVDPAMLRPGDEFLQTFRLSLPSGLPPNNYTVAVGLYNPTSGERVLLAPRTLWRANGEDYLRLTTIRVP